MATPLASGAAHYEALTSLAPPPPTAAYVSELPVAAAAGPVLPLLGASGGGARCERALRVSAQRVGLRVGLMRLTRLRVTFRCSPVPAQRGGHRRSASTPAEELAGFLDRELSGAAGGGAAVGAGQSGGHYAGADLGGVDDGVDLGVDLASMDPKRAKRILANRQSAARSKERKLKHAADLEARVTTLQAELAAAGAAAAQAEHAVQLLARERQDLETHIDALERHKAVRDAARAALQNAAQQHEASQAAAAAAAAATVAAAEQQQVQSYAQ